MPRTRRYNVIDYNYEKSFRDRGSGIYKILNHHEYKIL